MTDDSIILVQLTLTFFFFLQNSMNLPPDKARLLRQYDNEKKWELICDQVGSMKSHLMHCDWIVARLARAYVEKLWIFYYYNI